MCMCVCASNQANVWVCGCVCHHQPYLQQTATCVVLLVCNERAPKSV